MPVYILLETDKSTDVHYDSSDEEPRHAVRVWSQSAGSSMSHGRCPWTHSGAAGRVQSAEGEELHAESPSWVEYACGTRSSFLLFVVRIIGTYVLEFLLRFGKLEGNRLGILSDGVMALMMASIL